MKILQVNKYHYPRGGADKYYLDLGSRLEKLGHQVAYFSMEHPSNQPTTWSKYFVSRVSYNENIWQYAWKIPGRTLYSLEAKRKFTRLLKDFKPDIIHVHNIYHQLSPSILDAAAAFKIPVVMHLHDYKLVCPNHSLFTHGKICQQCLKGSYWPCVSNRCVKNSSAASLLAASEMFFHHKILKIYEKKIKIFISPSLFLKNILIKTNWPPEKIKVVNNAFSEGLPEPRATDKEDYFLYYGRLSEEKGVDIAIKAINANRNLKLKIAGTGPDEKKLKALGETAIKEKRLEFLGWQDGQNLSNLIAEAKGVIIPSRWLENFPLNALEAISLGTAVIATDTGGLPEIINHDNGLLVPLEDYQALEQAMLNILSKKVYFSPEKIKKSAEQFTAEINTDKIISIYQDLLK